LADSKMMSQMTGQAGFIAALDQSGGSSPGALRIYGVADTDYDDDEAMFHLMHEMRVRIMTAPTFSRDKVIGAILFEKTMDGEAKGRPVPSYLWEDRGVGAFPQSR
jgi:fructose-bisphosphate aldolase class I